MNNAHESFFTAAHIACLGASAATTYSVQRSNHNKAASVALNIARKQIKALGKQHAGGFDCVPFRRASFSSSVSQ